MNVSPTKCQCQLFKITPPPPHHHHHFLKMKIADFKCSQKEPYFRIVRTPILTIMQ